MPGTTRRSRDESCLKSSAQAVPETHTLKGINVVVKKEVRAVLILIWEARRGGKVIDIVRDVQ